jgi:hypothetical protein
MSARSTASRQNGDDRSVPLAVAQLFLAPGTERIRRVVIKGGAANATIDIKRNGTSILPKANITSGAVLAGAVVSYEFGGRQDVNLNLGDTLQVTSTQSDVLITAAFMQA